MELIESIPEHLYYLHNDTKHISTYEAWKYILDLADSEVNIASFYWDLLANWKFNITAAQMVINSILYIYIYIYA